MLTKLLLKSFLLRKLVRLLIPASTTADLTESYTNKFDAVAAEQAADAIEFSIQENKARAKRVAAEKAKADAKRASANIRKMLEAED